MSRLWLPNEIVQLEFDDNNNPKHRYYLECTWNTEKESLVFVLLNPSNTDFNGCDNTVEKIITIARQNGYGGIKLVNLFSIIDPNSSNLKSGNNLTDSKNKNYIIKTLEKAKENGEKVVLGWGEKGFYFNANAFVLCIINNLKLQPYCLGILDYNMPVHPGRKRLNSLVLQTYKYEL